MTTTLKEESLTASIPTPIDRNARNAREASEASVQVLVAEVRTLVVGSRQVTMSVYSQLDETAPDSIQPFGRVRPCDHRPGVADLFIHAVGRHEETGALVRSHIPRRPLNLDESGCLSGEEWQQIPYELWRSGGQPERELLEAVARQWQALPLIVLAGLR